MTFALAIGITLSASGGSPSGSGGSSSPNPGGLLASTPAPGSGAPSDTLNAADISRSNTQKPNTSDASDTGDASDTSDEDVQDDTLTRLKTKDTLAAGAMGREEGQLTRKTHRRERVLEVESTKQLKTSGTDPKFQGSLLHSSVTSIEDVSQKANSEARNDEAHAVNKGEARFDEKRLVFTEEQGNDSKKKKEKSPTQADSSPSPSPSPSPSASPHQSKR